MPERKCSVKGCGRKQEHRIHGLCVGHYRRYERQVRAWRKRTGKNPSAKNRKVMMETTLASGALRKRNAVRQLCKVEDCERLADRHKLCGRHAMQADRAGKIAVNRRAE